MTRLRATLPLEFNGILDRLLRKQPEERYANWAEAALAIASVGRLSIYDQAVPDSEKYTALRASPLTSDFNDIETWDAVRHGLWRRVPAQHVIVREGEPGDSLLLIARGTAAVTAGGRMLNLLNAGDCFGGHRLEFVGAAAQLDATRLAAPAGMHLGLDHPGIAAKFGGRADALVGRADGNAARGWNAVVTQDGRILVFNAEGRLRQEVRLEGSAP